MQKRKKSIAIVFFILTFITMLAAPNTSLALDMKIIGTISDYGTITTDSGDEYYIDENEKSFELMDNIGKKVTVEGNIVEEDEEKTITITSYKIMEDDEEE